MWCPTPPPGPAVRKNSPDPIGLMDNFLTGMPQWRRNKWHWDKKIEKASRFLKESVPPLKTFSPKNSNLDVLESNGKVLEDSYWDKWDGNSYTLETGSFISHVKLAEATARLGINEKAKVLKEGSKHWGL